MKTNAISMISGISLAMMAAGLAGYAPAGQAAAKARTVELVHCSGVNSCKGHNDCKTAGNACAGQGSCKGQGFVAAGAAACTAMDGKVEAGTKFKVAAAQANMTHCMGVNSCKGHNDCKTASNACKGHGSCKGQGFVALPAATCAKVGGTAG